MFFCIIMQLIQTHSHNIMKYYLLTSSTNEFKNRPFYSCVLSYLAMNASKAGGDVALIKTSLLFSCK